MTESALALVGSTVIDGTGRSPQEGSAVIVRGDRIVDGFAAAERALPEDVEMPGVMGAWVVPGLIEAHCHVAGLAAAPPTDGNTAHGLAGQVMPMLPRYGITAV